MQPVSHDDDTRIDAPPPPTETAHGPVSVVQAERRMFGLAPPALVLVLAVAALGLALAGVITGHWIVGAVFFLAAVVLGELLVATARRLPEGRVARGVDLGIERVREQAGYGWVCATSWSRASRQVVRSQVAYRRLQREHARVAHALGLACYRGDDVTALRASLAALDARIEAEARLLERTLATSGERMAREREAIQPTQIVRPSDRQQQV